MVNSDLRISTMLSLEIKFPDPSLVGFGVHKFSPGFRVKNYICTLVSGTKFHIKNGKI